jgi:hypothetical protein
LGLVNLIYLFGIVNLNGDLKMQPQKYCVIIENGKGTQRKKDGFLVWEEATKYAEKHTSKKECYNVQSYWD